MAKFEQALYNNDRDELLRILNAVQPISWQVINKDVVILEVAE